MDNTNVMPGATPSAGVSRKRSEDPQFLTGQAKVEYQSLPALHGDEHAMRSIHVAFVNAVADGLSDCGNIVPMATPMGPQQVMDLIEGCSTLNCEAVVNSRLNW